MQEHTWRTKIAASLAQTFWWLTLNQQEALGLLRISGATKPGKTRWNILRVLHTTLDGTVVSSSSLIADTADDAKTNCLPLASRRCSNNDNQQPTPVSSMATFPWYPSSQKNSTAMMTPRSPGRRFCFWVQEPSGSVVQDPPTHTRTPYLVAVPELALQRRQYPSRHSHRALAFPPSPSAGIRARGSRIGRQAAGRGAPLRGHPRVLLHALL